MLRIDRLLSMDKKVALEMALDLEKRIVVGWKICKYPCKTVLPVVVLGFYSFGAANEP